MTIFLLPVLALCAIYVGTVETAFSALMRLSLRLTVERTGRAAGLGVYLDDPVLLFVPARLLWARSSQSPRFCSPPGPAWTTSRTPGSWGCRCSDSSWLRASHPVVHRSLRPRADPERAAAVVHVLTIFLRPLSAVSSGSSRRCGASARRCAPSEARTQAEDESAGEAAHAYLEAGEQEGLIEREEHRLIESIVDFGDTLVREVMTPRPDIIAVRADATLAEVRQVFGEQQYSRVPVYRDIARSHLGFVFVKDLIRLPIDLPPAEHVVERLLRPAHYVPETKKVAELLQEFQRQQVQSRSSSTNTAAPPGWSRSRTCSRKSSARSATSTTSSPSPSQDEGNGVFVFSGKVAIDELNDRLGVDIPRDGFETIGGYVLAQLGRVPVGRRAARSRRSPRRRARGRAPSGHACARPPEGGQPAGRSGRRPA